MFKRIQQGLTMSLKEKYLTYAEVADLLNISISGLRSRFSRREGMPPSIKIGRRRLFPESEFYEWMREHQEPGYPQATSQYR